MTNSPTPNSYTERATLTESERESMKHAFTVYMNEHPQDSGSKRPVPSPYMAFLRSPAPYVALAILMLGATTYAADQALPYDTLYDLKTEVIEPVALSVAFTDEARAGVHGELVERRLEEAQSLAEQRVLTPKYASELKWRIENHADEVISYLSAADTPEEATDALTLGTELEASLNVYSSLLEEIEENVSAPVSPEALELTDSIEEQREDIEDAGEEVEQDLLTASDSEVAAQLDEVLQISGQEIERLDSAFVSVENNEDVALLRAQANEYYARGVAQLAASDQDGALASLRDAHRFAEEGLILLTENR